MGRFRFFLYGYFLSVSERKYDRIEFFQGTPFIAKSYDAAKVTVGSVTKGTVGRNVQFSVDAGDAGEGNLEITISAKGHNIPTQVHPQGNAKYEYTNASCQIKPFAKLHFAIFS